MHKYFDKRIFITASLGNTHDGNVRMAKKLIVVCNRAKVDAVKFQKRNPKLYSDDEYYSPVFGKITKKEYREKMEFWKDEYDQIEQLCKELGIYWYVSVYDIDSLQWMEENYSPGMYKISSCKITDLKLVKEIAKLKRLTFMSTGMATIKEVDTAVNTFLGFSHTNNLILMHCCSIYPSMPGDINLRVMRTLHKHYKLHTGYDSHDTGLHLCNAAVGMGAKAIEKHVTLDKSLNGNSHSMALEPNELEQLVSNIRDIEKSFGSAHKKLLDREIKFRSETTGESEDNLIKIERS